MYGKFLTDLKRYDFIFYCEREKPYMIDGTRKQTEEEARRIDMQIKHLLDMHKIRYYILNGATESRTKRMCETIGI